MSAQSCFAPRCGINGRYAHPGVCNAPGGHRYKAPAGRTDEAPSDSSPRAQREGYQARPGNTAGPASPNAVGLPRRCQSIYAGSQCSFVLGHDHPHGTCDSDTYVTWGRMASDQQPTVGARETLISTWQRRAAEWTDSRFPDDDLKQRGLVLGEETGEVLRCILKGAQDIRGGRDHWIGQELPKEAVDVFFCLVALAHRAGFDLADAIEAEWARIAAKDYTDG